MKKKIEKLFNYLREFFKKHEQFCFFAFVIALVITVIYFPLNELINTLKENEETMYSYYVYQDRNMLSYYNAKEELVQEVEKYINSVAPNSAINAITLVNKCDEYNVDIISIGNGTASRESEKFCAEMISEFNLNCKYIITSEAGASIYSASKLAIEEFPDLAVEKRSAVSIGRRLQDPLAELVKIPPEGIGVG